MTYCTVRQADTVNVLIENSSQPTMNHCTISNSGVDGIVEYASNPTIQSCLITGNAGYPLVYKDWTCDSYLSGNSYTSNGHNYISLPGGSYTANRTLYFDHVPYEVKSDINIIAWGGHPRLTIKPGNTFAFDPGTKIMVGSVACCNGGELFAEGKADSLITFGPINNLVGGWGGITFTDFNDDWGGTSSMKYCNVSKGATFNVSIGASAQPVMDHCTLTQSGGAGLTLQGTNLTMTNCVISNSAGDGISGTGITGQIVNTQITGNGGYALKYNDISCNPYIHGNTYSGNTLNYIYLSGGESSGNLIYYADGIPYRLFSDIRMAGWGGHPRLTLKPGVTIAFEPTVKIQLGTLACCNGGDLWAEGKADSIISFLPYNSLAGGWGGVFFTSNNDEWGGVSSLKYCSFVKGAGYNVNIEGSNQPSIDHCTFNQSTGKGLIINSSNISVTSSTFSYNSSYGVFIDGSSTATIGNTAATTCNLFNNGGGYQLYNNTPSNINARFNYWGTADSTMIEATIFDRYDNAAKGIVYITGFRQVIDMTTPTTILGGTLKYANASANPIKNAVMTIKDSGGSTVATTTSNSSGVYAFSAFPSGSYTMSIVPAAVWGGVNSTDALLILNHFAMVAPLSGLGLAAADVNASHTINGTDAFFVMKRYSGMISSFASGDYLYHTDTLFTSGNSVTNNFKFACYGDCNLSYAPAKKSTESVGLVHEGTISVPSFTEFDFPVKLKYGMDVGAISLGFYYPEQYLEITDARLENGNNSFSWTAADGLFRMR